MITPSYLGETIEYSSLHACRSTLEDPTVLGSTTSNVGGPIQIVVVPSAATATAAASAVVHAPSVSDAKAMIAPSPGSVGSVGSGTSVSSDGKATAAAAAGTGGIVIDGMSESKVKAMLYADGVNGIGFVGSQEKERFFRWQSKAILHPNGTAVISTSYEHHTHFGYSDNCTYSQHQTLRDAPPFHHFSVIN